MSESSTILPAAVTKLGLTLSDDQIEALHAYCELLRKWNKAYNLISATDLAQLYSRHLIDSLAIAPFLDGNKILDVGTGAGLPGIPLAIAAPDKEFLLLDSNGKKTRFLFQAKQALGLDKVEIENCRVEHYQSQAQIDIVTCRAFAPIPEIIRLTEHLFHPGTVLLAMKGRYPEEELQTLPDHFELTASHRLEVPGQESERHLLLIRMQAQASSGHGNSTQ